MKLNKKQTMLLSLIAAGVIGTTAARKASANDEAAKVGAAEVKGDKDACKGKEGCDKGGSCNAKKGHKHSKKHGDKHTCKGKESCKGKKGAAEVKAPEVAPEAKK